MIRILIVDDQSFTRRAVQALLDKETDLEVVGQASSGADALKLIEQLSPDVALVDLEMPEMNGFSLTYQIAQQYSQTKVVILSSCEDRESIDMAVQSGAKGFLLKNTSGQEIGDTIRYVKRGYFQLGPGLLEKMISTANDPSVSKVEDLSRFQAQSEQSLKHLEEQIDQKNNLIKQELFRELEIQIDSLKQDFGQGLQLFQQQVKDRMSQGFSSLNDRTSQAPGVEFQRWEQQMNFREQEQHKQISQLFSGTQRSISNLEKKVEFFRNCLIFLAIAFVAEKIAMLVF